MDEITLTRGLGSQTPLPTAARLAPARQRLAAELSGAARAPRFGRVRLTAVGVGVAASVLAWYGVAAVREPEPARPVHPIAAPERSYSMRPVAQVMDLAAAAALTEPDVVPQPDEFLYRGDFGPDGRPVYEIWKSVDGSRDGLVIRYEPGGPDRSGISACPKSAAGGVERGDGCSYDPAVLPDLPADVEGIRAYLMRYANTDNEETLRNSMAKEIWELTAAHHLRPAQRAALYRLAGELPGLRVVEGVTDAAGRPGTAVQWAYFGTETMWVFDARTHRYLGTGSQTSTTKIVRRVGDR